MSDRLRLLSSSLLFRGLSESERIDIALCGRTRTFERHEFLFAQGQPVQHLIVLSSGNVKQTKVSSSGDEVLLRLTGRGDVVNVHAEFAPGVHTCSACAMERCKAVVWEYSRIQVFLRRCPGLQQNIGQILARQILDLEERFHEMATESVGKRLAHQLLRLATQIGRPSSEGIRILITREDLAQMTGTNVFTLSRVLSKWSEQGLIIPRREMVVISNPKRLELWMTSSELVKSAPAQPPC